MGNREHGDWRRIFLEAEGRALLVADWDRALFVHYEVDPDRLQRGVPFELDFFDGRAFVSLVAFTMERFRPAFGGRLGEWMFKGFGRQTFLNVRTYVRCGGEPGIHFITEWMSHPLCVPLGRPTFGLPYRWGRMEYEHRHEDGLVRGRVEDRKGGALSYRAGTPAVFQRSEPGSLDAFLVERYLAFTSGKRRGDWLKARYFRIWHQEWLQGSVEVDVLDDSLVRGQGWYDDAKLVGGHYSPGVKGVWMGRPRVQACFPNDQRSF